MKKVFSIVMAFCMALSLAACGGSEDDAADPNAIKIGGIGPITGSAAQYGEAVKNGIQLAVDEINAKGGIQFAYKFEDDENDIEKGVNAYNSLKDWGMQVLIGATTSDPTIAIGEESYNDNIFQLTPSGTAEKCVQYDNAFRVCFSDPNQGTASAKFIGENKLATKVGVIYDSSTSYSSGIYANFKEECEKQGIEIVAAEPFTADNKTDMSVQVQKCQAAGAELVFLPIYYTEATQILTTADAQGYKPLFFGCDGLDGILNVDKFDLSLAEGVMLLTPYVPGSDEITTNFTEKYKEAFGIEPNQFAADAYDGVYAIAAACEKAGVTADMSASEICDKLKTAFTEISVDGVTSAGITWSADGEPNKEPKAVKIENGVYAAM
ncbi:ABC transporter substrate-binding protein [uncultured Ruthenibacterium sp.]|uniref:ABC transporter substrate-binding protein n=1 Tax=uncultured Ruthenibacterium sp. TaxID=1905347 RepID=UPI00349EE866